MESIGASKGFQPADYDSSLMEREVIECFDQACAAGAGLEVVRHQHGGVPRGDVVQGLVDPVVPGVQQVRVRLHRRTVGVWEVGRALRTRSWVNVSISLSASGP